MSLMLAESLETPARIRELLTRDGEVLEALAGWWRASTPAVGVTIARGSSDHAAAYGAYLMGCRLGLPVASLPPSLITLEEAPLRLRGQLALAVSQSGRSPDLIACLAAARGAGAMTVGLVNDLRSPLAAAAEHRLGHHAGEERSVAATKSCLGSMVALARLVSVLAEDAALAEGLGRLPDQLATAADAGCSADAAWLGGADHVYVVARGPGLPAAQEAALKLKETCGLHAEAVSAAELRHGPREIVGPGFAVLALALPGPAEADVRAAADELAQQGATVRIVGVPPAFLTLPTGGEPYLAPIVALQAIYPLVAAAAEALGRDPDRPATLAKVTRTY
jgi:glucosamine--fructose-6-phosphate aminotransferase (isomerizing)